MLGVVIYLTKDAVTETLKAIASLPAGTEVVFDFALPSSSLTPYQRWARSLLAERVGLLGEPWINYYEPVELGVHLRDLGFRVVEDLAAEKANEIYFSGRRDGLMVNGSSHIMRASV